MSVADYFYEVDFDDIPIHLHPVFEDYIYTNESFAFPRGQGCLDMVKQWQIETQNGTLNTTVLEVQNVTLSAASQFLKVTNSG